MPVAYVEKQKYALMGHGGWVETGYRAVCDDPRHGEPLSPPFLMQTWMAEGSPTEWWISAQLDAIDHNIREHPRRSKDSRERTWEEIVAVYEDGGESRASRRGTERSVPRRPRWFSRRPRSGSHVSR